MSIRNSIWGIICSLVLLSCQTVFSSAGRAIEKQGAEAGNLDGFYSSLQKRYKLLIAYYPHNPSMAAQVDQQRFVFCYNSSSQCMGYIYTKRMIQMSNNVKQDRIDSIAVSRDAAEAVLKLFKESKGWNLNYNDANDDSAQNYCFYKTHKQCFIRHGETYQVAFIYKNRQAVSLLYAPDRYEKECCQGNINRQRFITIKAIMETAFKKTDVRLKMYPKTQRYLRH